MNNVIKLPFINDLKSNLSSPNNFLQVILGPRQVGKTTTTLWFLENEYKDNFHYISADKVFNATYAWLLENWQIARSKNSLLVIDEIQKLENWSELIKVLWDEEVKRENPIKCILLGSSSLDIQRGLSESLTGRFQLLRAFHWNFFETTQLVDISLDEYLQFGGYPGSYKLLSRVDDWSDYLKNSIIKPVIEKDILLYQVVKSPALFKQAFEILCSYPAQEISYTKLLGQLQAKGNTDLIKHYIHLLEGAYLFKSIEKYSSKKILTKTSSPKIIPLCPTFYYMEIQGDYNAQERGRAFELIVGNQLLRTQMEIFYWREGNNEVDFVVKKGKYIWAVEVKSGRIKKLSGLENFCKLFPKAKPVIITPSNYVQFEANPQLFLENS